MPSKVLTAKLIEALKAPAEGQLEVFDKTMPGFGIRVSKGGKKAWVLLYRHEGRKRRLTLGAYPAMSLADARTAAGKAIHAIQHGDDPAHEKLIKRSTQPSNFDELATEYLERYAKLRKRSWKNDEIILRRHVLPEWRHSRLASIKRADVIALIEHAEANGQLHLARQILAIVRKLFSWAMEKSLADANPATGIRLGAKPKDRSRTLSLDELRQLWAVWDQIGYPWGPYFKLLLLTAQRRSEVASMRWDQLDEGVWTIPPEANKSARLHMVPLSPEALAVLESVPRTTSPFVFPARSNRGTAELLTPISGFSAKVRRINALLEHPFDWRIHDLRRTATSMTARLGFPPHILAAVLNHAPQATMKGVLAVYNRYEYLDEKRAALEAWGRNVSTQIAQQGLGGGDSNARGAA